MKDYLIVVDIQNDFVDGALGTDEAQAMIDAAAKRIRDFSGKVFVTMDTHFENYMDTREGKKLPVPHCIKGTDGWQLNDRIREALYGKDFDVVEKHTFGSTELPKLIRSDAGDDEVSIELIGLCTDICVVSNALILKANFCESEVSVDASCCAGVTPETHRAALETMKMCQINVK
ncbi:MAG: isochorismatase family cysteine hydrolase [Eubacteriales bacterium]|nr:isochorismatase family cysteine hydrolase [Eubacteriales bacterium]